MLTGLADWKLCSTLPASKDRYITAYRTRTRLSENIGVPLNEEMSVCYCPYIEDR
jgi:hypothetical protein